MRLPGDPAREVVRHVFLRAMAPELVLAASPADDAGQAIVIGAGGEVYEPNGKGA